MEFFVFFLLFFGGLSSQENYNVHLVLERNKVNPGQELRANCSVTSTYMPIFNKNRTLQVIWFKILKESLKEVDIATNHYINSNFDGTGRYKVILPDGSTDPNVAIFMLVIADVRVEDSGYIGCRIGGSKIESFKNFVVFEPVRSVVWRSYHSKFDAVTYTQDEILTFHENEQANLACFVSGSYPTPFVKVYIGSEDISKSFNKSENVTQVGNVRGLQKPAYKVLLFNESLRMHYKYIDKQLKCKASVHPFSTSATEPDTSREASIYIKISQYKPKFFCTQSLKVVKNKMRNMLVSCVIMASPQLTHLTFNKTSNQRPNRLTTSNYLLELPRNYRNHPTSAIHPKFSTPAHNYQPSPHHHHNTIHHHKHYWTKDLNNNYFREKVDRKHDQNLNTSQLSQVTREKFAGYENTNEEESESIYYVKEKISKESDTNSFSNNFEKKSEKNQGSNNSRFNEDTYYEKNKKKNLNLLDRNDIGLANSNLSFRKFYTAQLEENKLLVKVVLSSAEKAGAYEFSAENAAGTEKHTVYFFEPVEMLEKSFQNKARSLESFQTILVITLFYLLENFI